MDVGLVTGSTRYVETIREFDNFHLTRAVLFYFISIKLELEKEFQLKFYVVWNLVSVTTSQALFPTNDHVTTWAVISCKCHCPNR